MDTASNRLGTRLVTTMTVTIPLHHMAIIFVAPSSHSLCSTDITTELIDLIENPLLYIKQPYLCVIDTSYRFYDKHQSKCITLVVNVSDEELRKNQGITICFVYVADVTEIHHGTEPMESMNEINKANMKFMNQPPTNLYPRKF